MKFELKDVYVKEVTRDEYPQIICEEHFENGNSNIFAVKVGKKLDLSKLDIERQSQLCDISCSLFGNEHNGKIYNNIIANYIKIK